MAVTRSVVCHACLLVYTTVAAALSAAYLFTNWGVHDEYVAVRASLMEQSDGASSVEGLAFTESGGAEYLLVSLYCGFHVLILLLLAVGRKRNLVMGVACALLLACSLMYILFYGCIHLQGKMEQYHALTAPGEVPLRKPAPPEPYKLTVDDVDRTIASGNAGADAVVAKAPTCQQGEEGGSCRAGGMHSDAPLSYANLGWTVLETLVDVLAAIVAGPEDDSDGDPAVQRYHRDGVPIDPVTPFASIRRTSLLVMSGVGFVLSLWGVSTFDLSPEGRAKAANPQLTASALSQLASGGGATASATAGKAGKKDERSDKRRQEKVAAALQEAQASGAAKGAKKNQ